MEWMLLLYAFLYAFATPAWDNGLNSGLLHALSLWFPISLSWFHNSIDRRREAEKEKCSPSAQASPNPTSTGVLSWPSFAVVALNQTLPHFTLEPDISQCPQEFRLRSVYTPNSPPPALGQTHRQQFVVVWHWRDMIANRKMLRKITFPRVVEYHWVRCKVEWVWLDGMWVERWRGAGNFKNYLLPETLTSFCSLLLISWELLFIASTSSCSCSFCSSLICCCCLSVKCSGSSQCWKVLRHFHTFGLKCDNF